jgi:hypothetical protein
MTNTSTSVNDAIRAIVTLMRAETGYRSPWPAADGTLPDGVSVYHTLEAGLMDDHTERALIIGDWGDPEAPQEAADGPQRPATLGTLRHRQEDAVIRCRVSVSSGDVAEGSVQAVWDAAVAIVDDVDAMLRATGSLGLVPGYRHLEAVFAGVTATQPSLARGPVLDVYFGIAVSARL